MTSAHPLACLTRSDGETSTCYHSFYWIELLPDGTVNVLARIPSKTTEVDNVEQGLHIFVSDVRDGGSLKKENCGNFVITTSDGSRYYAFWRGLHSRLFVALSRFPHLCFSRQLTTVLSNESPGSIRGLLLTLCETPILPACGLSYSLRFSTGSLNLNFNTSEQIIDGDINMVPLSIFSPQMLVVAWESIMLERKVLLTSDHSSIISPCCEFLRRLILPLNLVNTFVPLLPRQLIGAIEAPFPYLYGAVTSHLLDCDIDVSNIVWIDLDNRTVSMPALSEENPDVAAPTSLKVSLVKDINDIIMTPVANWMQRSCRVARQSDVDNTNQIPIPNEKPDAISNDDESPTFGGQYAPPHSEESFNWQADQIIQLFVRTNLSLLTARDCTVRAFYRYSELHNNGILCPDIKQPGREMTAPYGFDLRCGVAYGCLQLLKEGVDEKALHFLTCWAEFDDLSMSIYEHADQLPLHFISASDINFVQPVAIEPDGLVFEVRVNHVNARTYRFLATDEHSRASWVRFVDEKRKKSKPIPVGTSSVFGHARTSVRSSIVKQDNSSSQSDKIIEKPAITMSDDLSYSNYPSAAYSLSTSFSKNKLVSTSQQRRSSVSFPQSPAEFPDPSEEVPRGTERSPKRAKSMTAVGLRYEPSYDDIPEESRLKDSYDVDEVDILETFRFVDIYKSASEDFGSSGGRSPMNDGYLSSSSSPYTRKKSVKETELNLKTTSTDLKIISRSNSSSNNSSGGKIKTNNSKEGMGDQKNESDNNQLAGTSNISVLKEDLNAIREASIYSSYRFCIMRTQIVASLEGHLSAGTFDAVLSRLRSSEEPTSPPPYQYSPFPSISTESLDLMPERNLEILSRCNTISSGNFLSEQEKTMGVGAIKTQDGRKKNKNEKFDKPMNYFLNSTVGTFLWQGGTAQRLIQQIQSESTQDFELQSVIDMLEEGALLNEIAAQKMSQKFMTTPTDSSVGSSNEDSCHESDSGDSNENDNIDNEHDDDMYDDREDEDGESVAFYSNNDNDVNYNDNNDEVFLSSTSLSAIQDKNKDDGYDNNRKLTKNAVRRNSKIISNTLSTGDGGGAKSSSSKNLLIADVDKKLRDYEARSINQSSFDLGPAVVQNEIAGFLRINSIFYAKKKIMETSHYSPYERSETGGSSDNGLTKKSSIRNSLITSSRARARSGSSRTDFQWVEMTDSDVEKLKANITHSLLQCEEAINKILVEDFPSHDRMLLMMKIAHNKEKIELNKSSTISNEIIIHIKNCIIGSNDNGSSNYNDTISVPHSNNGSQKNINRRKSTIFDNFLDNMWAAIDIMPQNNVDSNGNSLNPNAPKTPDKKSEYMSIINNGFERLKNQSLKPKTEKSNSFKNLVVDTSYQMTDPVTEAEYDTPAVPTPSSFFSNLNPTPTSPLSGFWSSPFITTPSASGIMLIPSTSTDGADMKSEVYNQKTEMKYQRIIRRKMLSLLQAQLQSAVSDPTREHLTPILQIMVGRLHDRMGDYENALKCYSLGKFVSQSRIVMCLSKKYLCMVAESRSESSFLDMSLFLKSSQELSATVGLQAFRLIGEVLLTEESSSPNEDLTSGETDTQTDIFISEDEDDDIDMDDDDDDHDDLREREKERLRIRSMDTENGKQRLNTWQVSPGKHTSLNQPFSSHTPLDSRSACPLSGGSGVLNNSTTFKHTDKKPVAYSVELLIELLDVLQSAFGPAFDYFTLSPTGNAQSVNSQKGYNNVNNVRNENAANVFSLNHSNSNDNNEKRKQTSRRTSFVDYFTKSSRPQSESRTTSYDSYNTAPPVPTTSSTSFWFPSTPSPNTDKNMNKSKKFFSQDSGDHRYNNKINTKMMNNNHHIDIKSKVDSEVEVDLLTVDVQSPQAVKAFFNILTSKAFSSFESKIAQLKKMSILDLEMESLFVFFTNIYNTLFVHAMIVRSLTSKKAIGKTSDRLTFIRAAKYNIGGSVFSLFDIEYSILRSSSEKPRELATFFSASTAFSKNDPRKIYALHQAVPFVSFVLCTTSTNSPRIHALYNPESLHLELRARAQAYVSQNVTYSIEDCKIYLPSIFNDFSRDFCSAKSDIVNIVIGLSANKMREELKSISNSKKMKLSFNSVVWNPSFII